MPSRGNPNVPNKQRRVANRAKIQKKNSINKISKNARGTAKSSVLAPTSGPLAIPSGKKARKIEKAKAHARKRQIEKAMEQEGEVQMTGRLDSLLTLAVLIIADAPKTTKPKSTKSTGEEMDIDGIV